MNSRIRRPNKETAIRECDILSSSNICCYRRLDELYWQGTYNSHAPPRLFSFDRTQDFAHSCLFSSNIRLSLSILSLAILPVPHHPLANLPMQIFGRERGICILPSHSDLHNLATPKLLVLPGIYYCANIRLPYHRQLWHVWLFIVVGQS
jgi:hypothetical protein